MAVTEYIGPLVGPVFADPVEWTPTRSYEALNVVINNGNSYTARQDVPVGIQINNKNYWVETGNYNAQIEAYRQEVLSNTEAVSLVKDRALIKFDTVSEMISNQNLKAGNACITLGFHSINDNGGCVYVVTENPNHSPYTTKLGSPYGDVIKLQNNLYAELVSNDTVNAEQLGCVKNVSTFDNGEIINEFCQTYRIIFGIGIYYFINAINMFDARHVHLEGFYQASDSNSKSVTIFDFTNCQSQIAVNAAGAFCCYLENIDFRCGRYQSICLYMDTTDKTQYSQYNTFVGCAFKAAEDHSVLNGGSVGVYIGEAEISTFENCTFMGCRPLVYTLDDMYNVRKIGNGTKSPHLSATFTSFTKLSLFISYAGSDIITLEGTQDVNFDNAYTQFYWDSKFDIEQSHNVIRLCNIGGHSNRNINGIFISENNNKTAADVTELNIDGSLGLGPNNNLNIKAICVHPTALGIKLSSYLDNSELHVTGSCSNSIQTVGNVSVGLVHFVLSNAPGNIDHVYNCIFTGIDKKKLTITPECTGLEVQWFDPKYVKYAYGSYIGYTWGKPTRTDVEPGTVYFNMNVHSDATLPIAYVFINNEWHKLTNGV